MGDFTALREWAKSVPGYRSDGKKKTEIISKDCGQGGLQPFSTHLLPHRKLRIYHN